MTDHIHRYRANHHVDFRQWHGILRDRNESKEKKKMLQQETMNLTPREVTFSLPSGPSWAFYPDSLPAHRMTSPTITVVVPISTQAVKITFIAKVRISRETNLCSSPSSSSIAVT